MFFCDSARSPHRTTKPSLGRLCVYGTKGNPQSPACKWRGTKFITEKPNNDPPPFRFLRAVHALVVVKHAAVRSLFVAFSIQNHLSITHLLSTSATTARSKEASDDPAVGRTDRRATSAHASHSCSSGSGQPAGSLQKTVSSAARRRPTFRASAPSSHASGGAARSSLCSPRARESCPSGRRW